MNAGKALTNLAESWLEQGARERGSNRGPDVSWFIHDGGGRPDKAPPWCAYFVSSLCRQLERCGFDLDAPKTGRAVNFWLKTDDHQHVDRDHIWSERPDGLVFVRTRLSKSERERDKVLNGMSRQGHTGIVTYIDTTAREIHCVAGNSSGFGHSRVRGGGQVAREIIREGDDAWARLVGFVRVVPFQERIAGAPLRSA